MMNRRDFGYFSASAMLGVLAGCGIRPQEQVEPASLRNAGGGGSAAAQATAQEHLNLVRLGKPYESTPIGYGFIPDTHQSYVVYQDGSGRHFTDNNAQTDLEAFTPRLREVYLAGPSRRRIVGFTNRGTWSSWNTANSSQQLVLRPQQTTFNQTRVIDVARVADSPVLATAAEGRRLELWSLVSGNLSRVSTLPEGINPRVVMPDGSRNAVVFGTESGEVRVWKGSSRTSLLYAHDARVLSITRVGSHGYLSTAQDGRAFFYDLNARAIVARLEFDRAVYDGFVAADHRTAIVLPTQGSPGLFDPHTKEAELLPALPGSRYSQGQYTADGRFFLARHIDGFVSQWDLEQRSHIRRFRTRASDGTPTLRRRPGTVLNFAIAHSQNAVLLTNDTSVQMYDLNSSEYLGVVLKSTTPIIGISTSTHGDMALVSLADGTLARFRPWRDIQETVQI